MRITLLAIGLVVSLAMPGQAQSTRRLPIGRGAIQLAGSAQLTHSRDIGNDRGWSVFEVTPRIGYFVLKGLAVNANLRLHHGWGGGSRYTEWGVGPGLTYYVKLKSRRFYPFLDRSTPRREQRGGLRITVGGGGLYLLNRDRKRAHARR